MKKTKRTALPKRVRQVQTEAEKAINRGYKATLELLPAGPRKVVKDLANQIETTAEEITTRGQKALKVADKRRKALLERIGKAARSFERRSGRALSTFETDSARFVNRIERTVADVVRPLARRLDLAALSELEQINKRLAQVERKLHNGRRAAA
jgi:hypothetical protein